VSLQTSYTLLAPLYDFVIDLPLRRIRQASLARLPLHGGLAVLIDGIGTGLDLPLLPAAHRYCGLDLTRAMLDKAQPRRGALELQLVQGDSQRLSFRAEAFDIVVMHLILAIVPDPARALIEAARVLRPGGSILLLDKFLRRGERAPLRRRLSPLAACIATHLDVVFEDVLAAATGLTVVSDEPVLARGWFRSIELRKTG
jgi:phosphatidylethanolamine/phosphatidyl-N-methylethanolamine N-methyltransferase